MMQSHSRLQYDLEILLDMYPELQLNLDTQNINTVSIVRGKIPFQISLPQDMTVTMGNQHLVFSKFANNQLSFEIDRHKYPSLRRAVTLTIDSQWMSAEDKSRLLQAIHNEFDAMTDPESEAYDEYAPVMMLVLSYLTDDSAAILFTKQEILCESQLEFDKFTQVYAQMTYDEMALNNFDCSICMETKKGDKMIKLPCQHVLCIECIKSYYTAMIEQGNIDRVRCVECDYCPADVAELQSYDEIKKALFTPVIPFGLFDGILSAQVCKKYKDLFHSQAATKLSKHCAYACVTCRRCGCWCVKECLDEPMIQCKNCDFTFCFDCLHSWHGYNNVCGRKVRIPREIIEDYVDTRDLSGLESHRHALEAQYGKRMLEMEANEFIADRLLDEAVATEGSNLQRCPRCHIVVQRSEGCNKMKCTVCGTLFCYICGEMLYAGDPYEHYRNPVSECYARLFEGMPGIES